MPYSCWTITTSVALRASTQIARRDADPSPSDATTSGSSSDSAGPHRTTSTVAPRATRPALNAAANVAIPHAVGGNVESMPKDRTPDSSAAPSGSERIGLYMGGAPGRWLGRGDRPAKGDGPQRPSGPSEAHSSKKD